METLQSLLQIVEVAPPTNVVSVPGPDELRKSGAKVVESITLGNNGYILVYENGYAVYDNGTRYTVMRLHDIVDYRYRPYSRIQQRDMTVCEDDLMSSPWTVGTVMVGEDRIVHSQNNSNGYRIVLPVGLIPMTNCIEDESVQDVISLIIEREEYLEKLEKVEYALSKITEKQRKAVIAYFFGEGKKKDIAESLGISPENFSYLKTAGINSIRRVLGIKVEEDKKQNS